MSSATPAPPEAETGLGISYNLWREPWIGVLRHDGQSERVGIRDCLAAAHELRTFTDPSPLVVASLQRLLAAIIQDVTRPSSVSVLADLIHQGWFDVTAIDRFGDEHAQRFDLFSPTEPFLQTGDIGLAPSKGDRTKTVGYLFPEEPTATNINHFFHRYDDEFQFSPATAALGLITVAAFATSGGSGIRPSINGVPPLYVLPAGGTVFETLALSIVTPEYQPRIASREDRPAWRRDSVVERGREVQNVGYLESLTFPARRVRLFPEYEAGPDSRTGEWSDVLVRRMVFDMGHARPKNAEPWFDPFAAYRMREQEPTPIRPQEGKTLWREYGNLFQTTGATAEAEATSGKVRPPAVVLQLAALQTYGIGPETEWHCRCIGIRTDMKAKVFEWVDETLDVPPGLLADPSGQFDVEAAITRAEEWERRVAAIHRSVYGGGRNQHDAERNRMLVDYWTHLAIPFRIFVHQAADVANRDAALSDWSRQLFAIGELVLTTAAEQSGDRGEALRQRAQALSSYRAARAGKAKDWLT